MKFSTLAGTVGGAYAITRDISVSLGIRYIDAIKTYKGSGSFDLYSGNVLLVPDITMDLDVEDTADGFGGIIGIDYMPVESINLAVRYETQTDLKWTSDVKTQDLASSLAGDSLNIFTDGGKSESNLPALLAFGVHYQINPKFYTTTSLNYYFIKQADKGDDSDDAPLTEGYNDNYDNGWEVGVGLGYKWRPDLEVSIGYLHSDLGGNSKTYTDFETALDADTIGLGAKYTPVKDLDITFAFGNVFYSEGSKELLDGVEVFNKHVYAFGFGIQYRFNTVP